MSRPRRKISTAAPRKRGWFWSLLVLTMGAGLAWAAFQTTPFGLTRKTTSGKTAATTPNPPAVYPGYAGSASCEKCHEQEFNDWKHSHHGLAERDPVPAMDNAAFIPKRSYIFGTQKTTMLTNDGRYELITPGLHGTNQTFVVQRILADSPLRQMLIAFPGGRFQATEAAWDPRSNQWFDVYGNEDRKPGEWGHWTGRGMNWNSQCAVCHNTRLQKNYDAASDSYHTTMAEIAVGCEACHGPMKAHDLWQEAHQGQALKDPTIHKLTRDQMTETCAGCHSRRAELTDEPAPGASYWNHYLLTMVDTSDTFYPDGQIHDEDYEYTAFLGSRMYNHGVRCMDCHNPHTMKPKLPGNLLCLSCHAVGSKIAPNIDPLTHSHHPVFGYDAQGILTNTDVSRYHPSRDQLDGECINCHMPQTVYMQRHWRHDHGFTLPDPLLTKQFGIPNACNRCHVDKSTDWSLGYVEKWYGSDLTNRPYHLRAETLARARQGDASVLPALLKMLQTNEFFYWRAAAANLLQPWADQPQVTQALIAELANTNPLVRQMVVQALGPLVNAGRADVIAALRPELQDPSRNVRVVTAQQFAATLDTNSLAGQDYLNFLNHGADQPLGQLAMGDFIFKRGDITNALPHFQTAAQWDPGSPGIRHELAIVLSQLGENQAAVAQLEAAVKLAPNEAETHYDLALAFNAAGDTGRVIPELEQAVKLNPQFARAWYNLGLARSGQGDLAGAVAALLRAESANPSDPRIPYARATVLARQGNITAARTAAQRALELAPGDTDAAALLQQLNGQ
ncbi:MAG: tetratricopeptide repeat protein [Solirubrobacteraceae bacterium]